MDIYVYIYIYIYIQIYVYIYIYVYMYVPTANKGSRFGDGTVLQGRLKVGIRQV